MKTNRRNILKYIRIISYIICFIALIILKYTNIVHWTCFIKETFGITCPTCGATRAITAILDLNIPLAIEMNAYVTLVLIPIFIILLMDDIISMMLKKKSFVEIILGE